MAPLGRYILPLLWKASWGISDRRNEMWSTARAMMVATGFGLVAASSASAAPANGAAIAELGQRTDPVIQIRERLTEKELSDLSGL
jgi:hypothetical protein